MADQHTFVQAPVKPMDADGVAVAFVGTVLFALAWLVLWFQQDRWLEDGTRWWLGVTAAGTAIGVVGIAYTTWRVRRRRARG